MDSYVIGILWAIGRYAEEEGARYFFLRHKARFFLDVVKDELGVTADVYTVTHKGQLQHRLKAHGYDTARELEHLGWQPRWAEERDYPGITDHRDFIRAYLEIHAAADIMTIRKRGRARRNPRLRIYGNRTFLQELTEVLAAQVGTHVKTVQKATNQSEVSGILYYSSMVELENIFSYIYRPGTKNVYRKFHDKFLDVLREFRR